MKVRLRLPPHLYSVITLPSKTHTADILRICNILKFTQNSLVLTPYLLNYSLHSLCLSWVKIQQGEITADGDNHRVEKISQCFIDSSFNE